MKKILSIIFIILTFSGCVTTNSSRTTNTTAMDSKTWDEFFDGKDWQPVNLNQDNANKIKKAM